MPDIIVTGTFGGSGAFATLPVAGSLFIGVSRASNATSAGLSELSVADILRVLAFCADVAVSLDEPTDDSSDFESSPVGASGSEFDVLKTGSNCGGSESVEPSGAATPAIAALGCANAWGGIIAIGPTACGGALASISILPASWRVPVSFPDKSRCGANGAVGVTGAATATGAASSFFSFFEDFGSCSPVS